MNEGRERQKYRRKRNESMILNKYIPKDGAQTLYIRHNTQTLHDISHTYSTSIHSNKHTPPPTNTLYRYTSLPNSRLG